MVHVNLKSDGCITTWKTFIDAYDYPSKTYLSTSLSKLSWEDEKSSCWGMSQFRHAASHETVQGKSVWKFLHSIPLWLVFHDWCPIADVKDERLLQLSSVLFFLFREKDNSDVKHMKHEKTWTFFSMDYKSYVQLLWMITITYWIHKKGYCWKHIFLARGLHHGARSKPNYQQYWIATNCITLCQKTKCCKKEIKYPWRINSSVKTAVQQSKHKTKPSIN